MKLRGILLKIQPTTQDDNFYKRWEALGEIYYDNKFCSDNRVEAIVTDHHTVIDDDFIDRFPNLKYVVSPNTGLTHITFKNPEIKVISLKGEKEFLRGIRSVAEFTIFQMLKISRESNNPSLLSRKTLGILGLGRIGTQVRNIAESFGMKVIYTDVTTKFGIPNLVKITNLFSDSDFVSIHIPECKENVSFVSKAFISLMKPTSVFINTSRASVVDNEALFSAYDNERIAGIISDVNWDMRHRYSGDKSILLTPHIAGSTIEDRIATDRFVLGKLAMELNLSLDNIL